MTSLADNTINQTHKGTPARYDVSNDTSFVAVVVIVTQISPEQKLDVNCFNLRCVTCAHETTQEQKFYEQLLYEVHRRCSKKGQNRQHEDSLRNLRHRLMCNKIDKSMTAPSNTGYNVFLL